MQEWDEIADHISFEFDLAILWVSSGGMKFMDAVVFSVFYFSLYFSVFYFFRNARLFVLRYDILFLKLQDLSGCFFLTFKRKPLALQAREHEMKIRNNTICYKRNFDLFDIFSAHFER